MPIGTGTEVLRQASKLRLRVPVNQTHLEDGQVARTV